MNHLIGGIDKWNDVVTDIFSPMTCSPLSGGSNMDFNGKITCRTFEHSTLSHVSSEAIKVSRNTQNIGLATEAYYLIKFQLKGQGTVWHQNREANLEIGDFVICSSVEPYEIELSECYEQAVISLPQYILQDMFQTPDDFLGRRMGHEQPIHNILSQFVRSLSQQMNQLTPDTLQGLEANLISLLISSLKSEIKTFGKKQETSPELHLKKIKGLIALHLKDYRLSVDFIAQAENISKRYLHMLFKRQGVSVSRYIQKLRLEGCYKNLSNPEFDHISTSYIALDWGFGDVSHFYRCFKSQYLLTPRQLRLKSKNKINA